MRSTPVFVLPSLFLFVAACDGSVSTTNTGGSAGSGATTGTGGTSSGGTGGATTGTGGTGGATTGTGGTGGVICGDDVTPPNEVVPGATDPEQGDFTMDEALVDLPEGPGPLRAIIETDLGTLTCTLFPNQAPIGVANFVGLARGRRAFKDTGTNQWVRRPFYDGLTFHRVIPDFVAQGGDPLGTGFGGPGYKFINEIAGLTHKPGTLAYANAGANTNGSQFYVCETAQPQLDSVYNIFSECEPVSVVTALTHVPTNSNDKPLTPVYIQRVTITRCAPE
ncbi:MAG: peptidylprolyl isomerase [Polyangiaceae bacterium]|nr:peptidylprolyl isomerase [Polyangiaceae bacterium]